MSPDDESTPTDDASGTPVDTTSVDTTSVDTTSVDSPSTESPSTGETQDQSTVEEATSVDGDTPDDERGEGVEAEGTLLEKSQAAIDDAHEAVQRVAATDAIGEDATGAGDLPPFADSAEGVEKPDPDEADDA